MEHREPFLKCFWGESAAATLDSSNIVLPRPPPGTLHTGDREFTALKSQPIVVRVAKGT